MTVPSKGEVIAALRALVEAMDDLHAFNEPGCPTCEARARAEVILKRLPAPRRASR